MSGTKGIVAFVTNSGFIDGIATDGMRKQFAGEFDEIYILDLGGNVRKNPKLSGTTHNVFGIQVGVSINIFVRRDVLSEKRKCKISYAGTDEYWTRETKGRIPCGSPVTGTGSNGKCLRQTLRETG